MTNAGLAESVASGRVVSPDWPPPGLRLVGKTCIVTGAGSRAPGIGIGRAIAIMFLRQGANVVLVDRHRDRASETLELIESEAGHRALVLEADVAVETDCERLVQEAAEHFGRIDVLVNNVGIAGPPGNAVEVDLSQWERAMNLNLTSMVAMSKYVIPHMEEEGAGSIINISSVAAIVPGVPSLFYPVSKGAVMPLTRAMSAQHGHAGIRVNCIAAGLVITPLVTSRGMPCAIREARRLAAPLQTEGDAWDVAYGAVYLASDEARWVTGVLLPVDAGLSLGGRIPEYSEDT